MHWGKARRGAGWRWRSLRMSLKIYTIFTLLAAQAFALNTTITGSILSRILLQTIQERPYSTITESCSRRTAQQNNFASCSGTYMYASCTIYAGPQVHSARGHIRISILPLRISSAQGQTQTTASKPLCLNGGNLCTTGHAYSCHLSKELSRMRDIFHRSRTCLFGRR